jgi:drug/metabolite transporter (DMT)-like permease
LANSSSIWGAVLVGIGALLWATDAVFRTDALKEISPAQVVFLEHLIALTALLPFILIRYSSKKWRTLSRGDWIRVIIVGVGSSALATLLFTSSFRHINPSITILLQKLQPVIVVFLAALFLGERPKPAFLAWAGVALISGVALSFPDFDFGFLSNGLDLRSRGVMEALGAATLWAIGTVAGRRLTQSIGPTLATFWRFAFGFFTLLIMLLLAHEMPRWGVLYETPELSRDLVYIALLSGLTAMLFYYQGLARTPASVATFVELVFPIAAVTINWFVLKQPLSPIQVGAATLMLVSVARASKSA